MRFVGIFGVLCGVFLLVAPAAGAQTEGLTYTEDTVFTVRDGFVEVEIEAVMANTTAEDRQGNTIFFSFFDSLVLAVPTGAQDLSIVSRGSELSSTAEALDDNFEIHTAALPSQLRPGDSRSFTIRFVLPDGDVRGDGLFVSNPAFHAFPIWSFSDPGTGSLRLRVPEDADLNDSAGQLRPAGSVDGFVEWEPRDFENPEELFAFVTVAFDELLRTERFAVVGQQIELQAWPGDDEWADFTRETIEVGLPALETTIGIPVPDQSTLEVTESLTPNLYGYSAWYDQLDTSIEIGNELDDTVIIHELSHAWFNNDLFVERWISEGLAEEFTWHVQTELGWDVEADPSAPNPLDDAATPLVGWGTAGSGGVDQAGFQAEEQYGYNASWFVVREMTDIIGLEQMRGVIAQANGNITAYGDTDPEATTTVRDDWRRFLDLASVGITPEQEATLVGLFSDFVVEPDDVELLEQRTAAREQYRELVGNEAQWDVPADIRLALDSWRFEDASSLMAQAAEVQARFVEVDELATASSLVLSDAAQVSYERNGSDFALLVLDEQEAAIDKVETVRTAATRELTTDERWGLREVSRRPYVEAAEAAFASDEIAQIDLAQTRLDGLLAQAAIAGADRILWLKYGIAAMVGIFLLMVRRLLRRNKVSDQRMLG